VPNLILAARVAAKVIRPSRISLQRPMGTRRWIGRV
jgi:hypothetical protein